MAPTTRTQPKLGESLTKTHTAIITKDDHPHDDDDKRTTRREFTFTFSSDKPDRDNDVIDQMGIDLERFLDNPVVLWAHNRGFDTPPPPVARVLSTWFRDGSLMGTVQFPPEGVHELSDTLHGLVDAGFIKAVSIGFRPLEFSFDEERGGINFQRIELFEVSLVPVPMNADALIDIAKKGLDVGPIAKWLMPDVVESVAAPEPEPSPAWTIKLGDPPNSNINIGGVATTTVGDPTPEPVAVELPAPALAVEPTPTPTDFAKVLREELREELSDITTKLRDDVRQLVTAVAHTHAHTHTHTHTHRHTHT